jgi:hypothetical protein
VLQFVTGGPKFSPLEKDFIDGATWNQLGGDRPATSNTLTVTDNISAPQRFYRVSAVPAQ